MALKLPRLTIGQRIVNSDGTPASAFQQYFQQFANAIERTINGIQAALDAAGIAQEAAMIAQDAAAAANAAAADASGATAANAREQALVNSYIEPNSVLTATPTSITITAHTRHYADGTSVEVDGDIVPATASLDVDYVSYNDPDRLGGSIVYIVETSGPVQTGNRHVVGAVEIPATGTKPGGRGPMKPGFVQPD